MKEPSLNIAGLLGRAAMGTNITPIVSLLIFLIGLIALIITPREENPQIDVPAANVIVKMPGATPDEVHNLIVRPLERVLREMPGVDHSYGMANDSLGVVTVQFEVGEDKEASLVKLYDRVMHNLDRIPPGASQPLVKPVDVDDVPIIAITLSSNEYNDMELNQIAERVNEQLTPLEGISVTDIIGGRNRTVTVNIDPGLLSNRGISLSALHQALSADNIDMPVGTAIDNNQVKRIRLSASLHSAKEVGNIVIAINGGRPVYLRDVATINDGPGEIEYTHRIGFGPATDRTALPDEPEQTAVTLILAKKRGTNAVVVSNSIVNKLEDLRGDFIPDNIKVTVTRNSGKEADAAVNMLIEHLSIAIFSVIVILLLFLGWREASIVTLNIPLILFIVLAVGLLADQTINRITLFALILALGLLVDDAIVVVENIHRHLKKGINSVTEKASLIIRATNETGRPTIVATFAVVLAFIPMAFVTGMMGPYMGPIPFNTPVAMLASLVIAYMLTPWLAQRWMRHSITDSDVNKVAHNEGNRLQRLYKIIATPLIELKRWRLIFWILLCLLFLAAIWQPAWQFIRPSGINGPMTPGTVELKMLPKGNQNTFNMTIDLPEGSPLEITDAVTREIGDILRTHPMIKNYQTFSGIAGPVDFNGMLRGAAAKRGSHIAEIRVNLIDKHLRSMMSEDIVMDLRNKLSPVIKKYPKANIKLVEDPPGPPVRATMLAEIYGPNYQTSRELAKEVRKFFHQTWDVVDVDDSVTDDQIEYRVSVDKEKAATTGIDAAKVGELLHDFVKGFDIGTLHSDIERHPINVRTQIPRHFRIAPRDLDRLFITNATGQQIPVASIANIEEVVIGKPILTKDGQPVAYVSAEPKTGSQVYPLLDLDKKLDNQELLPGTMLQTGGMRFTRTTPDATYQYKLLWDGEMRLTLDVFRDLGAAFIVALMLIFLLLVAYYGNLRLPLIVMGAIPLTMIGIFPGHLITGQPFTATSMIGMIALAGIVVRNSLLLIDFILANREAGTPLNDAVIEAGAVRARPILLTALAIIVGTAIMISDPVFGGLGVSMAFGTFASTVLTLFVIPLVYFLTERKKASTIN
ncbi:MAG: efflux RND transporter permease subunit [Gammaproteobacteria bacterium]